MGQPKNTKERTYRIVEIVSGTTGAPDHPEIMSMQMERMLPDNPDKLSTHHTNAKDRTHRGTDTLSTSNRHLNHLIRWKHIYIPSGQQLLCRARPTQNLQQNRYSRRDERPAVHGEQQ